MTMPRRITDWETQWAIRAPKKVPGVPPTISGISTRQAHPAHDDVADRGREDQRDRLDQVGADQLHRREAGVEQQQGDHHQRAGADRGDADEQPADDADEQRRRGGPDLVEVDHVAAGEMAHLEVHAHGVGRRGEQQRRADRVAEGGLSCSTRPSRR